MQNKIRGIFAPMLVPFEENGKINESELRRLVRWLIQKGVHGLYPNGSTGEATRLSKEERRRIVEITCDEVAGRIPVIAGTAEPNPRETLAMCEQYSKIGVRGVAVLPPFYYRVAEDSVLAHFSEIACNSPVDILLYNIPTFATPISLETVTRLSQFSRIIGIKDSSGDLPAMMRLIAAIRPNRPDFSFLTGWDPVLVPMLLIGCDGATNAISNVVPEVMRKIFDLCRANNVDEAIHLQFSLLPLFDAVFQQFEFPDGFRAAAELRGFSFGRARQPLTPAQLEMRDRRQHGIGVLLAELGLSGDSS